MSHGFMAIFLTFWMLTLMNSTELVASFRVLMGQMDLLDFFRGEINGLIEVPLISISVPIFPSKTQEWPNLGPISGIIRPGPDLLGFS